MLCTSKLAPTSSIKDMAICVATKIFRIRVAVFPAIAERPPCFNASTRFTRVPVSAGAKPKQQSRRQRNGKRKRQHPPVDGHRRQLRHRVRPAFL